MASAPRRTVPALTAAVLVLGSLLGLAPLAPPPDARAFYPSLHDAMFRGQLDANFSAEAQDWVTEGLEKNDAFPEGHQHPEWHFDSAKDPAAICALWNAHDPGKRSGPNKLLADAAAYALEAFKNNPFDPRGFDRVSSFRGPALIAYGQYLHAIQDFYTHTNWIELHVAAGKQPGVAPVQAGCDVAKLTAALPTATGRLQSGYFDIYSLPPDFCGSGLLFGRLKLPAGFDFCHGPPEPTWYLRLLGPTRLPVDLMLAKDVPNVYHGAQTFQLPGGAVTTYHDEAVRLATLATAESLTVLHDRVVAKLTTDLPERDPECLFLALIKGGDPTCPKRLGLGSHYQGEVPVVDDSALALWENSAGGIVDPESSTSLRDVRVAIQLDTANIQSGGAIFVTGGSLTFQFDEKDTGSHYVFDGAAASGSIAPVADGYDGFVDFSGTVTVTRPGFSPLVFTDHYESFELAVDAAGQPVLCQSLPLPTLDGVRQYQDCLARAVVRLQPAPAAPPIA